MNEVKNGLIWVAIGFAVMTSYFASYRAERLIRSEKTLRMLMVKGVVFREMLKDQLPSGHVCEKTTWTDSTAENARRLLAEVNCLRDNIPGFKSF